VHCAADSGVVICCQVYTWYTHCITNELKLQIGVCCVFISIGGIVLVSWSTKDLRVNQEPLSAICSVMGALMFALFLVLLRRRVDNEYKLNMPMFYGLYTTCWCHPDEFALTFSINICNVDCYACHM